MILGGLAMVGMVVGAVVYSKVSQEGRISLFVLQ
jgi:hypothetical protein